MVSLGAGPIYVALTQTAGSLGTRVALVSAGIGTLGSAVFILFAPLPASPADLSPWNHWRMPVLIKELGSDVDQGPVLVTVECIVIREKETEFMDVIYQYARIRRRDGAYRWGIFRDTEVANQYLETFQVNSWAEHLRQHERQTQSDRELEQRLQSCVAGDPKVRPSALREFDRNITRTAVARLCCACVPVLDCANDPQKESCEEAEENRPKESDTSEGGEPSYEAGEEEAHAEEGGKEEGRCSETAPEDGARGRSCIPVRTSGAALR